MASYVNRCMNSIQMDTDETDQQSAYSSDSNSLFSYNISSGSLPFSSSPTTASSSTGPQFYANFQRKSLDNGRFIVLDTLGSGATGKVKLGVDTHTGERVALKIIQRRTKAKRQQIQIEREIKAMSRISHPNVLTLLHHDCDLKYPRADGTFTDTILLVIELATGGEFFDLMMHTGALGERITRFYSKELLKALQQCHRCGVYHRDLKPENLLLDSHFHLKMADFGHSSVKDHPSDDDTCNAECGTKSYMAPEILSKQNYSGSSVDVWSAGVVLFIMLTGNPPFQIADNTDWWFSTIITGRLDRFWRAHLRVTKTISEPAQRFIEKMLQPNPDARSTIEHLLQTDAWLNEVDENSDEFTNFILPEMSKKVNQMNSEKEMERQRLHKCLEHQQQT